MTPNFSGFSSRLCSFTADDVPLSGYPATHVCIIHQNWTSSFRDRINTTNSKETSISMPECRHTYLGPAHNKAPVDGRILCFHVFKQLLGWTAFPTDNKLAYSIKNKAGLECGNVKHSPRRTDNDLCSRGETQTICNATKSSPKETTLRHCGIMEEGYMTAVELG